MEVAGAAGAGCRAARSAAPGTRSIVAAWAEISSCAADAGRGGAADTTSPATSDAAANAGQTRGSGRPATASGHAAAPAAPATSDHRQLTADGHRRSPAPTATANSGE